jgi:hypothetical protein
MKKMSNTKIAALVMLGVWVVAFALGYRKPILHLITGAACFMWLFEVLGAQPEQAKPKKNLGFRQP